MTTNEHIGQASSSAVPSVMAEVQHVANEMVPLTPMPTKDNLTIEVLPEEEKELVSFNDIMDACDCAVDNYEQPHLSRHSG